MAGKSGVEPGQGAVHTGGVQGLRCAECTEGEWKAENGAGKASLEGGKKKESVQIVGRFIRESNESKARENQ